jgi:hypothetical protein
MEQNHSTQKKCRITYTISKKTFGKELRAKGEMTIQYQAPELRFTTEDILDAISKTSLGKAARADELF